MSWDEFTRVAGYAVLFPFFLYFAFVHWNKGERFASVVLSLLATFFFVLMLGLLLISYFAPVYELLYFNTGVVTSLGIATVYATWEYRARRKRTEHRLHSLTEIVEEIESARQGRLPGV